jgi:hypothetical protein
MCLAGLEIGVSHQLSLRRAAPSPSNGGPIAQALAPTATPIGVM